MKTLVECWNKLEGNVSELNSWVGEDGHAANNASVLEDGSTISLEQLEGQLNQLKVIFTEKQKLVDELDAYGPKSVVSPLLSPREDTAPQQE